MLLVICSEATRLTAPRPASTTTRPRRSQPGPPSRRAASITPTAAASNIRATTVASSTLAVVQSWVSTAGSANTNPAPNPDVGTDPPAYVKTTIAASSVGGTTQAA